MTHLIPTTAVVIGLLMALINLVRRKWMVNVVCLSIQYLCVFVLYPKSEGIYPALIKLIVGLMISLIIYLTILSTEAIHREKVNFRLSAGEVFRALSGLFFILLVVLAAPWINEEIFTKSSTLIIIFSFGLILLGLLQLGSKVEPLYIIIGLLTFLSGFELLYGSLEFSAILEALFAAVNLILAIAGAFFIIKDWESEKT